MSRGWSTAFLLCGREWRRLARQPARLLATVGTPLLIWLLLASGLAESFRPSTREEGGYGAFLLPGMMMMVSLFASIFSSIALIEDRQEGWLRSVLVSPAPRWSIAAGKIMGGATLALCQALLLLAAAPFLHLGPGAIRLALVVLALALSAVASTALGLSFAWRCASTGSFHAVMNLLLFPMWLLSSALFPLDGSAPWLRAIMLINPLTWCTEAVRVPLLGNGPPAAGALVLAAAFAATTTGIAIGVISRPSKRLPG
jgi:ABC-2 type transport system permease protein